MTPDRAAACLIVYIVCQRIPPNKRLTTLRMFADDAHTNIEQSLPRVLSVTTHHLRPNSSFLARSKKSSAFSPSRATSPGSLLPPWRFEFLSDDFHMREGLDIEYRLRPLLRASRHLADADHEFAPSHGFADIQEAGPYRRWEHRHTFTAVHGGTFVEDSIEYELPLGLAWGLGGRWTGSIRARAGFQPPGTGHGTHLRARPVANSAPRTIRRCGWHRLCWWWIARELHVAATKWSSCPTAARPRAVDCRTRSIFASRT